MEFRYLPPAREEWRAFFIQIAGSIFALLLSGWWQALQPHFNVALFIGVALGVMYLLVHSAAELHRKRERSRKFLIELRPEALVIREGTAESIISWNDVLRCEAVETKVQLTWRNSGKEQNWSFAPREIMDGKTLARQVKQRATPNFIALEAK